MLTGLHHKKFIRSCASVDSLSCLIHERAQLLACLPGIVKPLIHCQELKPSQVTLTFANLPPPPHF